MARLRISYLCERCKHASDDGCSDCLLCDRGSNFIEDRRADKVTYDRFYKTEWKPISDVFKENLNKYLTIKNVIFHEPATIVYWADGTKTVVKCQEGDVYDPEKGLAMAIAKKAMGNKGNYCKVFKKWLPKEEKNEPKEYTFEAVIDPAVINSVKLNGGTISFDMKCVKGLDDLVEDLHSEIFNNTTPVNRIRGEEKK